MRQIELVDCLWELVEILIGRQLAIIYRLKPPKKAAATRAIPQQRSDAENVLEALSRVLDVRAAREKENGS